MNKVLAIALVSLLALVGAACSSGLTPQEYFTQLATINADAQQALTQAEEEATAQAQAATDEASFVAAMDGFIDTTVTTADDALASIEALSPPSDLQGQHDAMITAMTDLAAIFREAQEAIGDGSAAEIQQAIGDLGSEVEAATSAVNEACSALQDSADEQEIDVDLECASGGAADAAAQSSLRNALVAAKVIFTDNDDYSGVTAEEMAAVEPTLTYVERMTPSTDSSTVSFSTDGEYQFSAAVFSESGTCFFIQDVQVDGQGTTYGTGTAEDCVAEAAAARATEASW